MNHFHGILFFDGKYSPLFHGISHCKRPILATESSAEEKKAADDNWIDSMIYDDK